MATTDPHSPRAPADRFLHDRLADQLRGLIRDGTLRPGERVDAAMRRLGTIVAGCGRDTTGEATARCTPR